MREEAIAIVGMGAMLPGGSTVNECWEMILSRRSEIREVPPSRWDADLYYDPDPKASYRTRSKIGSFLPDDIGFYPKEFGLPPILKEQLDPTQQLALLVAREALEDCGATDRTPRNWAVFVGNLLGGSWKRGEQWLRTQHVKTERQLRQSPLFQRMSPAEQQELLATIELQLPWSNQPVMTPDSLPGLLGNLIASRIAHYYNLTGPNFTVDAACATSLAAIEEAVLGLRAHRFDAALAGGADRIMDASSFIGFSKMGVLSPDGSRPFDAGANGFVMGEGCALFVLKRYADAVAANDKIYGVIQGIGSSTDGQGRAIAAPNPEGQIRSLRAAYADAQLDPATVDLIECHGTSTPIGDPTEIAALRAVWAETDRTRPVAIGSIKSNLGHLKGAAGAAALLKAVLALHHRILPPQINYQTPNPHCEFEATPFRVQTEVAPWESNDPQHPRRCGVSAFGFGGINYHVVLEEAPMSSSRTFSVGSAIKSSSQHDPGAPTSMLPLDLPILGLSADTKAALADQAAEAANALRAGESLAAHITRTSPVASHPWRAAMYADDAEASAALLDQLAETLRADKPLKKLEAKGVFVREGQPLQGKVALMFPGQGSQYVNMMSQLKDKFPQVKETLDEADEIMDSLLPEPLSDYMIPPADVDEGTAFMKLLQTEVLQPAVLAADTALWRLLKPLLPVDLVMGHSLGEYGAAIAADVFSFADALRIVAARGEAIAAVADHLDDNGVMIGVGADTETVEALLAEEDNGYVIVANKNCPTQTIIAGATDATMAAAKRIEEKGIDTIQLPVSHAFHSDIVSPASPYLLENLKKIDIKPPSITLMSNVTAEPYPTDENAPEWIRETLSVHLARPVEWQKMVEWAYERGYRYFIEVGPKRALSSFVKDILKDREHCAAFSAHPKFGELTSLGRMLAQLIAEGLIPYGSRRQQPAKAPQASQTITMPAPSFPPLQTAPQSERPSAPMPPAPPQPQPQAPPAPTGAAMAPQYPYPPQPPAPPMHWGPPMPYMAPSSDQLFSDPGFWQFLLTHGGLYFHHLVEQYRRVSQHQYHMAQMATYYPPPAYMPPAYPPPPAYQPMAPMMPQPPMQQAPPTFSDASIPYSHPHFTQQPPAPASLPPAAAAQPPAPTMVNMPAFPPPSQDAPAHIATPTPSTAAPVVDDLAHSIVSIVADRTGYTTDELGLDEHLEADLGIDSIRQVEVMAEVRDMYQLPRDDNFNINDYNTLRALIGYVERMRSGGGNPAGQSGSSSDESSASG